MTDVPVPGRQLAIRLPAAIVARIERHAERLRQRFPGVSVTRTDAIRALLVDALDRADVQAPTTRTR